MRVTVEKRQPKRSRVLLKAHLEAETGQQDVRIRDISTNGALVEASIPPAVGKDIQLSCGDSSMKGRVAWVDGSWFGVEFLGPIETPTLADAVRSRMNVSAPRSYRHDRIPEEVEQIEVSPRVIRFGDGSR